MRRVVSLVFGIGGVTAAVCCGALPRQISDSRLGAYEAALATDRDGFAVAWYDRRDGNAEIYMRLLDRDGNPDGPERRLTHYPDTSYEASLARVDDDFIVAWYDESKAGNRTAKIGRWTRDGRQKWSRTIAAHSRNPVVRSDGRSIFCAWIQTEANEHEAVWGGWWDGDARPRGAAQLLGAASKTTWNLNAALEPGGAAWVVFDAAEATRDNELYAARVDGSTARVVRLTRDDGAASKYPDVAVSADGQTALTWYDQRDGNEEVYLFTGSLATLSGEIDDRARRVTDSPGESIGAYLAWNGSRIGLAWSDKLGSGQHEVFFQPFDAHAVALAPARRVTWNDTWSLTPAILPWADGFALAWNEYRHESNNVHEGTSELAFSFVR
jgi:hypothetical protein